MLCSNCKREIAEKDKFCIYCGQKINQESQETIKAKNYFSISNCLIALPPSALLLGFLMDPALLGGSGIFAGVILIPTLIYLIDFLREKMGLFKTIAVIWIGSIILCGIIVILALTY